MSSTRQPQRLITISALLSLESSLGATEPVIIVGLARLVCIDNATDRNRRLLTDDIPRFKEFDPAADPGSDRSFPRLLRNRTPPSVPLWSLSTMEIPMSALAFEG